ncbi:MAG: OmpA family protein [Prolixibacteraceae bacterium]|nr:OmpA family protein [Prolixibacteraceae bacterium]
MAKNPTIYLLFLILILLLPDQGFSQKLTTRLADKSFDEFAFVDAIGLYEYAYERDTTDNYVVRRLADANRNVGNTEEVERWLKKLMDRRAETPEDIFNYSQALKSNGHYLLAEQWLKEYSELRPEDGRVNIQVSLLEYIQFLMRDSTNFEMRNISLNTHGSDLGPAFYKDQLVFSSTSIGTKSTVSYKWNELPFLNMYSAKINETTGDLSSPEPFAPKLKTSYHDGPVSFDQEKEIIYFTRNSFVRGKTSKSNEGVVNLKIFQGKLEDGDWKMTGSFRYNSDEYSVGHPSVSKDGSILYFASDMPGGYGKSDVYFSVFSNGQWSKPFNVGPKINTEGNEFFPFISGDGVLYFSSDGHGGLGALDIYFSVPEQGVFNSIENMGYPVNSSKDDFGFALDSTGMKGYVSSNRLGGKGNDDLYFLKILRVPVIIRGVIRDRDTKDILPDATVNVIDENGKTIQTTITRTDGQFEFEVNKGQQYILNVTKEFYFESEKAVATGTLRPNDEVFSEIFLELKIEEVDDNSPAPISMEEEGGESLQVIELEYINYELDKSDVGKEMMVTLDKLIALLAEFPDLEIRIESHTDSRGSDDYNMLLSKKRARAAFDYVVSKGIDPNRLLYQGYGETRLLNNCGNGVPCAEEQHEVNRRSIVKVVRKGTYQEKRGQKNIFYF